MKLNKQQKELFNVFKKEGNLFVDSARRSGKTTLLKAIMEDCLSKKNRIVLVLPSGMLRFYKEYYHKITVLAYSDALILGDSINEIADVIVCDECIIMGDKEKIKHAIAGTFRLKIPDLKKYKMKTLTSKEDLEEFKKECSADIYHKEFGFYE